MPSKREVGRNFLTSTLPAIGGGAGIGLAALQIAKHMKASSPHATAAVAGGTALLGAIGSAVAPKGTALSSMASAITGLGAGLLIIDMLQKPAAGASAAGQPELPQLPRQSSGDYLTQDEFDRSLRRAMLKQHEETVEAVRSELRNAATALAPYQRPSLDSSPAAEAEAGAWLNAPTLPHDEYAENEPRNAASWLYASEPQAA